MNPARTGRGASNHRTHTTMKNAASASVPATPPNRFILGLVDMIKRERSIVFDEGEGESMFGRSLDYPRGTAVATSSTAVVAVGT